MDWSRKRRSLLAAQAALEARHRALGAADAGVDSDRQGPGEASGQSAPKPGVTQLHELREHHEELQEHHAALTEYQTALAGLPPVERDALSVAATLASAEVMLVEAGRAVDQARDAWRRATDVYKKVRHMLDRQE